MPRPWITREQRQSVIVGALALSLVVALKAFYSRAGASELMWILAPSSWLARYAGGIDLAPEVGAGFITHTHRMVVGPACAGVNFLLIALAALFFSFQGRFAGVPGKLGWLWRSVLAAYGATVVTNALRIVLGARLYDLELDGEWLTPGRLHRLAGALVYCASLALLHVLADTHTAPATRHRPLRARLVPFYWYLGVTLAVPLANRAYRVDVASFAEHALQVVAVCALVAVASVLPRAAADRLLSRRGPGAR